ncbi:MAG: copper homeostasis protein CutC [Oscillospiraceae bacterium]|nr:copper homeostasis protein CutC [Oscillospiraceae bacterium]
MSRLLEVCVDSLASARAAIRGGADRLELCSALAVGGLTPYTELLLQIRGESSIAIRCLMRPRAGDFLYDREEIRLMAHQIRVLKAAGSDGFVIGCLTAGGDLDQESMLSLIDAAAGSPLTLHRCIDVSRDPLRTYLSAGALGIDTVLTSGAAANCMGGIDTIGDLLHLRDEFHGPEVLIGAGVKAAVIAAIRRELPEARAFHMSGKIEIESRMLFRRKDVPMGLPGLDEWHIQQTSEEAVRNAKCTLMHDS